LPAYAKTIRAGEDVDRAVGPAQVAVASVPDRHGEAQIGGVA
jgi:hypothetical protein